MSQARPRTWARRIRIVLYVLAVAALLAAGLFLHAATNRAHAVAHKNTSPYLPSNVPPPFHEAQT